MRGPLKSSKTAKQTQMRLKAKSYPRPTSTDTSSTKLLSSFTHLSYKGWLRGMELNQHQNGYEPPVSPEAPQK